MRTALAFLALLPTLMPPGMCICQFAPAIRVAPVSQSAVNIEETASAHLANTKSRCSCDSCRVQALPVAEIPLAAADGAPSQEPIQHAPGCPAAADAVPLTLLIQSATIPIDASATLDFLSPIWLPSVPTVCLHSVALLQSAPPLFISHCALLI